MSRQVRMGIDVGGTHTKAVAIDNDTHEVIGKSSVKTTHDDPQGVAAGVVESFQNCLKENNINPKDVVFVAHSTTQATNALIEGDVAKVGVIGIGNGLFEGMFAKKQTNINDIDLGSGKWIRTTNSYVNLKKLQSAEKKGQADSYNINTIIDDLKKDGAEVIVASQAFGVDNENFEKKFHDAAQQTGTFATMASEITKLYGLTRRTRTAVINGSILPKMMDTANSTERSVRAADVHVPLMIMRGDGGVMEISEMKKRPVLTMLSGPAASVMGSLMYLRASNGIYFEVGGTTTNMGVIKNGRPAIDYSTVGKHRTYISSLDVKVLGCAGGSMIRANKQGVIDVGPRSAHIAGLDYAVYTSDKKITKPTVEFFSPKEGDPADYVAVRMEDGTRVTITNSCAANALGLVNEEHFSYGNKESAVKAIGALAEYCGTTVEDIATQIMERAYDKIEPVILGFAEKYKLEKDQMSLVGVGGGAASLIVYFANKMGLNYSIPENAEVISSIGVALAMVRDVVERVVPSPSKDDIRRIKAEALNKAIESGATPESVEVHIDIDPQTQKITAIATGSTEVKTSSKMTELSEKDAKELAAKDVNSPIEELDLVAKTDYFYVFNKSHRDNPALRIIDTKGFIRVQRSLGIARQTNVKNYQDVVKYLWDEMASYKSEVIIRPDFYVCVGARLMDFTSIYLEQLLLLMDTQFGDLEEDEEILIIAANNG